MEKDIFKTCFTPYDIRGKFPEQISEDVAYKIGVAYANEFNTGGPVKRIAVGRDVRFSSPAISKALIKGLNDGGVDTLDIGLCGTEVVYFTSTLPDIDGGIMVTASHNPKEYNGMKIVLKDAVPVVSDTGLKNIEERLISGNLKYSVKKGQTMKFDPTELYLKKLFQFLEESSIKKFKILANPGNGCAGIILKYLKKQLPVQITSIQEEPNGNFPDGVPNPLLMENRKTTSEEIIKKGADFGVAWDGDNDRCFFFDENGNFIEGYYIVGLIAERFLRKNPGGKIIYDPRLIWNTIDIVKKMGGIPLQNKTGHAFFKQRMRKEDAVYGGEMSAHHYFRDFKFCDSGMIPLLVMLDILSLKKCSLAEAILERQHMFPCSGEINKKVENPDKIMDNVYNHFKNIASDVDFTDGLSMEFLKDKKTGWRFNLRKSNTEPLIRLNVEAKREKELVEEKTKEILNLIGE